MAGDVLIVFGAGVRRSGKPSPVLRRRLEGAVAAAKRCRAPRFIVTGGERGGGPAVAAVMRQTLLQHGVPDAAIVVEPLSWDTLEQARRCAALLEALAPVGRVLVCTSPWHQPRCRLLLRLLGVRSEAPPMPADFKGLRLRGSLYYVARELAATAWDVALLGTAQLAGRGRLSSTRLPSGSRK